MFELDIEMLKEQGLQLMDSAKKTAQDLADKGKKQAGSSEPAGTTVQGTAPAGRSGLQPAQGR